MSDVTVAFSRRLIGAHPTLRPLLEAHLEQNHGMLRPYVLLGRIEQHVERLPPTSSRELLEWLENEFGNDDEIDNLIALSFIELLPCPHNPVTRSPNCWGPNYEPSWRYSVHATCDDRPGAGPVARPIELERPRAETSALPPEVVPVCGR